MGRKKIRTERAFIPNAEAVHEQNIKQYDMNLECSYNRISIVSPYLIQNSFLVNLDYGLLCTVYSTSPLFRNLI